MSVMLILVGTGTVFRYAFDYLTALLGQRVIKNLRSLFSKPIKKPRFPISINGKAGIWSTGS
jgi:hypothetical protein